MENPFVYLGILLVLIAGGYLGLAWALRYRAHRGADLTEARRAHEIHSRNGATGAPWCPLCPEDR